MEYKVEIKEFGKLCELDEQPKDVIYVARDAGEDVAVRFFCPCELQTPIYIPLGKLNNEGGSEQSRKIVWTEQDKVLSVKPSIQVLVFCKCHFWLTDNKTH